MKLTRNLFNEPACELLALDSLSFVTEIYVFR